MDQRNVLHDQLVHDLLSLIFKIDSNSEYYYWSLYQIPQNWCITKVTIFLQDAGWGTVFPARALQYGPGWRSMVVSHRDPKARASRNGHWPRRIDVSMPKEMRVYGSSILCVPGSKLLILGMVIPPLIGHPYNGYINPYYWVDDHPLTQGTNGSLDPSTCKGWWLIDLSEHHAGTLKFLKSIGFLPNWSMFNWSWGSAILRQYPYVCFTSSNMYRTYRHPNPPCNKKKTLLLPDFYNFPLTRTFLGLRPPGRNGGWLQHQKVSEQEFLLVTADAKPSQHQT